MYASMESERGGVPSVRFPLTGTRGVRERWGHNANAVTPHPALLAAAASMSKCSSRL